MLSVSGPGDADPRRPSLISQAYSEPPLTPSAQRARKILEGTHDDPRLP